MFGIIESDNRYNYLKKYLNCVYSKNLSDFYNIDYLILPFRGIDSLGIINNTSILLENILKQNSIKIIFVGHSSNKLDELKYKYGFKIAELLNDGVFVKENAFLTAKGILAHLALKEKDASDYNVLIIGFGNISFYLTKLLKAYNCNPSILAFDEREIKFAKLNNYNCINDIKNSYDIIINTIPKNLDLDYTKLNNSLVIDVASYPYGFSHNDIDNYKINYELLSAIPNRYYPESAALIIKKSIDRWISSCEE